MDPIPLKIIDPAGEIRAVQTELTRKLLYMILSLGSAITAAILAIAVKLGWHPIYHFITGTFLIALAVTLFHLRRPNPFTGKVIVGISFVSAAVSLISFGMASTSLMILCAVCVLSGVFAGPRTGFSLITASVLLIALTGFYMLSGRIAPLYRMDTYLASPQVWVIHSLVFIFVTAAIIIAVNSIKKKLLDSLADLNRRSTALLEKEREYRVLAENMSDVLFVQDMNLNIVFINNAATTLLGYPLEKIKSMKMNELLTPASFERGMKNFQEHARLALRGMDAKIPLIEMEYVREDGSIMWGELRVSFLRDQDGRLAGCQGVVRDISERKIAEKAIIEAREAAEKASLAKSDFITMMSHELRTPLTSILGFSELLYSHHDGGLSAEDLKICERINRNSRHLLNLINNILDLASIESGKMLVVPEKIDLRRLIEETVAMMSALAGKKPLEIVSKLPADLPEMETDGVKLMQVIINILGNAVKFTDEGRITISAERLSGAPGFIRISISDTGIGIPPDKVHRIFDKFGQAENVLTRKFGGAGLGLSISRTLMEMLGGSISVASEMGAGSTFILTLPVHWKSGEPSSLHHSDHRGVFPV